MHRTACEAGVSPFGKATAYGRVTAEIKARLDASPRRLRTDYKDLYQCHWSRGRERHHEPMVDIFCDDREHRVINNVAVWEKMSMEQDQ